MSAPTRPGTPGHDSAEPEPGDLIADSLARGREASARFMNAVRLIVTSAFVLVYLFSYFRLQDDGFATTAPHLSGYWGIALLLWFFGRRSRIALEASRFAVPLLDIPMVTWIQFTNIEFARISHHSLSAEIPAPLATGESSPWSATAVFTVALLLFLVAMSSFSLRARHLIPTTIVAVAANLFIYLHSGMSKVSLITGPLLILMMAAMMSWLPRRQNALIREAALRESRRNRLARYFSPGVAELIEDRDDPGEGESCEISVLFCDIRGFTRLSENLDASEVVRLLNDFHGHMVDEIFRYGGTLDKYLGDGLLAWFNAPVPQVDHAVRATRCALAMVERLAVLNGERETAGDEPLRIGIGLHAGDAVVGNVGASHRREFTAIGDTVNVASRLQSLTRDRETDILASDAIRDLVDSCGADVGDLVLSPAGSVAVRGRQQPVGLFIPSSRGEPVAAS